MNCLEVKDVLNRAADLVEKGWCQGDYAQDDRGDISSPWLGAAKCWCAVGAIIAASGEPDSDAADRTSGCYAIDCESVAHDVRKWCLERGKDKLMRICLAGYAGEHEELERAGWSVETWKAHGGYGLQGDQDSRGRANAKRERLWFSPHCLSESQLRLFDDG